MAASRSADGICNRLVAGAAIWGAFLICLLNPMQVLAGRNGNGALIVHTNDAVNYSAGADYCTTFFDNPGSCENANTRTDKDEETPAVIWVLAAFHPDSSPAVTAVQFGLDDNIPQGDGYWANWGKCGPGVLEIADDGWPDTGKNVALAYSEARTDSLFPVYWMCVYGFTYPDTAYLGTTNYANGDSLAQFADDSNPPATDIVEHFGTVRWWSAGQNDCPSGARQGGGQDSGQDELPPEQLDNSAAALDMDGLSTVYVRMTTSSDSACFAMANVLQGDYHFLTTAVISPDAVICRAPADLIPYLADDARITIATADSIPDLDPDPPATIDTRYMWNAMLRESSSTPADSTVSLQDDVDGDRWYWDDPRFQTSTYLLGTIRVQIIFIDHAASENCVCADGKCTEHYDGNDIAVLYGRLADGLRRQYERPGVVLDITQLVVQLEGDSPYDLGPDAAFDAVYDALGYTTGSSLRERGFEYNNDLRRQSELNADWAYHVFVPHSDCHREDEDSIRAIWQPDAQPAGPYLKVVSSHVAADGFVIAHETAHVFGAPDEYRSCLGSCEVPWGYLREFNGNCDTCSTSPSVPCIMHQDHGALPPAPVCDYTLAHLGWRDSDDDGLYDPLDYRPNGGRPLQALIENTDGDSLRIGDLIVVKDGSGNFMRTLPLTWRNSDKGALLWDGRKYDGQLAPAGTYYAFRDVHSSTEVGPIDLTEDTAGPELLQAQVSVQSGVPDSLELRVRFSDDSGGCFLRAEYGADGLMRGRLIYDEFFRETTGDEVVVRGFKVSGTGNYEMHVTLWDAGGNEDTTCVIPFMAGSEASVWNWPTQTRLSLGQPSPNPTAGAVKWELVGEQGALVDLRVVSVTGRTIRKLETVKLAGQRPIVWDGLDGKGRNVPAGKYYLVATDRKGSRAVKSAVILK
jgi:hypothetical protein